MFNKAIEKITKEMEENKDNTYIQVIGQHLLSICTDDQVAKLINNEDKSILKSLKVMRKEAEKKKNGDCAVLSDNEAFDIVHKYYGMDADKKDITVQEENISLFDML